MELFVYFIMIYRHVYIVYTGSQLNQLQAFFACMPLVQVSHMTKYTLAKTGEYPGIYPSDIPQFSNLTTCMISLTLKYNSRQERIL